MTDWPHLCANWTRNVALRIAHEEHLPIAEACPPEAMGHLLRLVVDGKLAEVVAKKEAKEYFRWWREGRIA